MLTAITDESIEICETFIPKKTLNHRSAIPWDKQKSNERFTLQQKLKQILREPTKTKINEKIEAQKGLKLSVEEEQEKEENL